VAGDKGWQKMNFQGNQQDMELTGPQLRSMRDMTHEAHVRSLLPLLRDPKFTLKALPEATVAGRPAVGVQASYPDRADVSLYFDKETHLLVKTAYKSVIVEGQPELLNEIVYGDYQEAGGPEDALLTQAGVKTDAASLRAFLAKQRVDAAAV